MQSWMFLSSYEKLRDWLLDNTTIITMAHLGGRAFDSISGEVVSATAFVMEKIAKSDYQGAYLRWWTENLKPRRKAHCSKPFTTATVAGSMRPSRMISRRFRGVP